MNNFAKAIFSVFFCGVSFSLFSQNVGINTTGATPSTNVILDLNSGNARNLGVLIPRVTLGSSLATFNPPMAHAATTADTDMIVYNSVATNHPIGYYYWNGSTWVGVAAGTAWSLTGNAGTSPGTNFLGTTDGEALEFQVGGQKSGWIDYGSNYNTSFGFKAFLNGGGAGNTALGYGALAANTSGAFNNGVGYQSLNYNTTGSYNTANGSYTLQSNTTGGYNTAIGNSALSVNTTGGGNTAIGSGALLSNTTSSNNTATGGNALYNNTTGSNNTAAGASALQSNTTGSNNTATGGNALYNNTTGSNNTAMGNATLQSNTTGGYNTAIGNAALYSNTNSSYNTAIGNTALSANTTGSWNTAIGNDALQSNTTSSNSTALGNYALYANTTGSNNTAAGASALQSNTTGSNNTATGNAALSYNTSSYNTANGSSALYFNTTGTSNTAMGYQVLESNTSGSYNTGSGYQSMFYTTTGSYNTGIGTDALDGVSTGWYNTALGYSALGGAVTNSSSTGVGSWAGYNNTGSMNVYLGDSAGYANTSSTNDVFIGYQSGPSSPGSNIVYLGNTSTAHIEATSAMSITSWSDRRVKDSIKENVPGLAFITKLKPVTFHYNIHKENQMLGIKDNGDWPGKYDVEKITQSGFIAQQVDSSAQACGYDFAGLDKPKTSNGLYALGYTTFVVPLVKSVQELSAKNDSLCAIIENIQARLNQLCSKFMVNSAGNSAIPIVVQNGTYSSSANTPLLYQNTPNSLNLGTKINYYLPEGTVGATIVFYDNYGNQIKAVQIGRTGNGTLNITPDKLGNNIYSYSLIINGNTIEAKRMVL